MAKLKSNSRRDPHIFRLIVMIVIWMAFMAITAGDKFYSIANFRTIAGKFPEFGIMSIGAMVCMITGGIDLSSVGVANMTAISMALFMKSMANEEGKISGIIIILAFVLAAIIGAAAGACNGLLISKIHIPPILATLGINQLLTGLALVITNGKAVSDIPMQFSEAITKQLLMVVPGKRGTVSGLIPVQLLFFIAAALIVWFLIARTSYGPKLYMLGTSENVARFSGLKVTSMIVKTYALSGILAAMGGMIMLANYNSARSDYGSVYTLQCILIVVLGGVSPTGGKGRISGVMLSIILLSLLESGINRFPSISPYYITLIWGAVLILAMVLDYMTENRVFAKLRTKKA